MIYRTDSAYISFDDIGSNSFSNNMQLKYALLGAPTSKPSNREFVGYTLVLQYSLQQIFNENLIKKTGIKNYIL